MGPFDTVIFDMDGTLLDTLDDLTVGTNYTMEKMGWPLHTRDEIKFYVGNGSELLIRRAAPAGTSQADLDRAMEIYKPYYAAHARDKTAPYPGIIELLKALKERGVKTAVVSNKFDAAVKELSEFYFPGLLDLAAGEDEANGVPKKPDPTMVLRTMAALGAEKAVYVGDSDTDMKTAHNSGLPCVSVTWGFRDEDFLRERGAGPIIREPMELLDFVRE